MMNWKTLTSIGASVVVIVSCFMHWTWYPDIQKYFTGFFSEQNYYGRPGLFLTGLATISILMNVLKKNWSMRTNLIISAIMLGYGITTFLRYTSAYDGFLPEKQFGIWLMLVAVILNLLMAIVSTQVRKIETVE